MYKIILALGMVLASCSCIQAMFVQSNDSNIPSNQVCYRQEEVGYRFKILLDVPESNEIKVVGKKRILNGKEYCLLVYDKKDKTEKFIGFNMVIQKKNDHFIQEREKFDIADDIQCLLRNALVRFLDQKIE